MPDRLFDLSKDTQLIVRVTEPRTPVSWLIVRFGNGRLHIVAISLFDMLSCGRDFFPQFNYYKVHLTVLSGK